MAQQDLLTSLSPNINSLEHSRGDVKMFMVYKGDTIQLPVNPEQLIIRTPGNNKTIPIISLGEINILKEPKLKSISFSSFFPVASAQNYPYVLTGNSEANFYTSLIKQILDKQNKTKFMTPEQYVKIISEIRKNKEVIRFIVVGLPETINGLFCIEKFDYKYDDGDYDIYYDIELKLYQMYAARSCTYDPKTGNATIDDGQNRIDDSDSLIAPYTGCKVNVNGNIYKNPSMQFADRYVSGKIGALIGLVDFDNDGVIHLRDSDGGWLGWVSDAAVTKATGM